MVNQPPLRSLVSMDDLTTSDIEAIFKLADNIRAERQAYFGRAAGKILATLFYEPSTRTRLSFEAAMQRLGGGVISTWDVSATSVAKGESLADTVRVVGAYADVIVLRHPSEGAAKLAAEYSPVPVINAGDGGHEHPTQTLCDLYTLRDHHGSLEGLTVALCGDLRYGRTVHSLAFALARFKANIKFVPGDDKEIPEYVLHRLKRDYGALVQKEQMGILSALFGDTPLDGNVPTVDAIYMTPTDPHQLALSSEEGTRLDVSITSGDSFSIYVTRRQTERSSDKTGATAYPKLTTKALRKFKNISILHPLPRVDEISPDIDEDQRSLYFKQASFGIPVRMALLLYMLGLDAEIPFTQRETSNRPAQGLVYERPGFDCSNNACIANQEQIFAHPQFEVSRDHGYTLRCLYCDHETTPAYVGNTQSGIYYPAERLDTVLPPISPSHVRFFTSSTAAEAADFRRVSAKWEHYHPDRDKNGKTWIDLVSGGAP